MGKTTTVLNVGEALARAGEKVLLVDLDPSGNLTHTLTKLQPDLRAAAKVTADHIVDIDPETRKPAAEAILDAIRPPASISSPPPLRTRPTSSPPRRTSPTIPSKAPPMSCGNHSSRSVTATITSSSTAPPHAKCPRDVRARGR